MPAGPKSFLCAGRTSRGRYYARHLTMATIQPAARLVPHPSVLLDAACAATCVLLLATSALERRQAVASSSQRLDARLAGRTSTTAPSAAIADLHPQAQWLPIAAMLAMSIGNIAYKLQQCRCGASCSPGWHALSFAVYCGAEPAHQEWWWRHCQRACMSRPQGVQPVRGCDGRSDTAAAR